MAIVHLEMATWRRLTMILCGATDGMQHILQYCISLWGNDAVAAQSETAVLGENGKKVFEALILDERIGELTGLEVLASVRTAVGSTNRIPVIFLTSDQSLQEQIRSSDTFQPLLCVDKNAKTLIAGIKAALRSCGATLRPDLRGVNPQKRGS